MNMNLISPFMMDGTKTSYIRKQTCIFQLLDCESVNDLLPSGMKVFKAKTAHEINCFFNDFFCSLPSKIICIISGGYTGFGI